MELVDMIATSLRDKDFEREYGCTRAEWNKKEAEYEAIKGSAASGQRVYMKDTQRHIGDRCTLTGRIIAANRNEITVEWLRVEHSEGCDACLEKYEHRPCWLEQPGTTSQLPFYRLERKISMSGNIYWTG